MSASPPPSRDADGASTPFAIVRDEAPTPARLRGAIAGIGNFDGLHRGHRALVAAVRAEARRGGHPAAIVTFEPHPRQYFARVRADASGGSGDAAGMFRLTSETAKLAVLRRLGLDGAFVRRFDAALAGTSAADFVAWLVERGLSGVVIGHDFHFGRGREGTPAMLAEMCAARGLSCRIVAAVAARPGDAPVSSTAVRSLLEAGEVASANALLGHRWFVVGEVRHGDKRGRTMGFPTANVALDPGCRLRHGIYAVRVALNPEGGESDVWEGVASYGRRPTFDDGAPLLEVHLFDFAGDLYGRTIAVEFAGWIRGEERFASAEALTERMHLDAAQARAMLAAGDGLASMIAA